MNADPESGDWQPELGDLVPGLRRQAGDDALPVESLREDLMRELAPRTAYERIVAGNLVVLELEAIRLRRMMDSILEAALGEILERYASLALSSTYEGAALAQRESAGDPFEDFDAEIARVTEIQRALGRAGPNRAASLEAFAAEEGLDILLLQAEVRLRCAHRLAPFEMPLLALEGRRRRLMADYERLRAGSGRRARTREDADLAEALSDAL